MGRFSMHPNTAGPTGELMNRREIVAGSIASFAATSSIMSSNRANMSAEQNASEKNRKLTMEAKPSPITFDSAKTAIIVVDMQNDFGSKGGMFDRAGIDISMIQRAVAPTARVLAAGRKANLKVVYLKMAYKPDLSDLGTPDSPNRRVHEQVMHVGTTMRAPNGVESRVLVRDTWNSDIVNELKPESMDTVIYKTRFSGFYETELDNKLKGMGVRYLIVTGCTTSVCVESTIRDAMFRDYSPVLLEDCTAEPVGYGLQRSNHEASLLLIQLMLGWVSSSDQFVKSLESSAISA
jgi:ureidoacrylate peracid hydrolase